MKKVFPLSFGVLFSLVFLPSVPAKPAPSPEMKAFLDERLIGKHDINLEGLKRTEEPLVTPEKEKSDDKVEVYQIPYPKQVADHFRYTVLREVATNRFTVVKTGGIAGVLEFYETTSKFERKGSK